MQPCVGIVFNFLKVKKICNWHQSKCRMLRI